MAYFDEVANGAKVFSENLGAASQHASATTTALHEASGQLTSFATILKGLATYAGMKLVTEQVLQIAKGSSEWASKVKVAKEAYKDASAELERMQAGINLGLAVDAREFMAQKAITQELQRHANLLDFKHKLSLTVNSALDEQGRIWLGALALGVTALEKTVVASHNLNKVLLGTNSTLGIRRNLVDQILVAQQQTGASLESTGEAARALVGYGMQLSGSFEASTELVVQLKEGLGVSAETAAKLATVWERGIKQPMRDAADAIAEIAAGTGLTADRAAELVTSLGRSARLLGPDLQGSVAKTAEMLGDIAGKIQGLGGNYQVPQDLARRLGGGGTDSIFLRAMGGVRSRESLTDPNQLHQVMENIARAMRRIVSADPSKDLTAYSVELETVANMYHMSADDARDFIEAMGDQQKAIDPTITAAKAYSDQMKATGQVWQQFWRSVSSVLNQAILPFIKAVTPFIQGAADALSVLARSEVAVDLLSVALPVALGVVALKTGFFVKSLLMAASNTGVATAGFRLFSESAGLIGPATAAAATGMFKFASIGSSLGLASKAGIVGATAVVAWKLGRWLDENFSIYESIVNALKWAVPFMFKPDQHKPIPVDTKYSSPLYAQHLAAQALLKGDKDTAAEIIRGYVRRSGRAETGLAMTEAVANEAIELNRKREFARRSTSATTKTGADLIEEKKARDEESDLENWKRTHSDRAELIKVGRMQLKLNQQEADRDAREAWIEEHKELKWLLLQRGGADAYRLSLPVQ